MTRVKRASASRWLGRRITGSCGGAGEPAERACTETRALAWGGPKAGRDYGYVIRREIDEK